MLVAVVALQFFSLYQEKGNRGTPTGNSPYHSPRAMPWQEVQPSAGNGPFLLRMGVRSHKNAFNCTMQRGQGVILICVGAEETHNEAGCAV